jgi:hypothetical protein
MPGCTHELAPVTPPVAAISAPVVPFPLFPVSLSKFAVMSICSFGIYELYWCYQNWTRLRDREGLLVSPFWRAFFAPLWGFSLFGRIRDLADSEGVETGWSAPVLATLYLVLSISWRLPDPWSLISIASFVPMLPVVRTTQRINDRQLSLATEDRESPL